MKINLDMSYSLLKDQIFQIITYSDIYFNPTIFKINKLKKKHFNSTTSSGKKFESKKKDFIMTVGL